MDTFVNTYGGRSLLALFRCGDGWRWCAYDRLIVVFATGTADRTAQELWLLVRLRRQAITGRTFAAARRDASVRCAVVRRLPPAAAADAQNALVDPCTIRSLWSV